jgi:hypothetical protein
MSTPDSKDILLVVLVGITAISVILSVYFAKRYHDKQKQCTSILEKFNKVTSKTQESQNTITKELSETKQLMIKLERKVDSIQQE